MKEQILKLRDEGKSYREIEKILGCHRSLISYHCGVGQKEKALSRSRKSRQANCVVRKVDTFLRPSATKRNRRAMTIKSTTNEQIIGKTKEFKRRKGGRKCKEGNFSYKQVLSKLGENPCCYLSGRPIDLQQPRTYSFDHIVPASKAGANSLENLGLTCKEANKAKDDLCIEEFLSLCVDVLRHHGYEVVKPQT